VSEIFSPLVGLLPIPDLKELTIDLGLPGPKGNVNYGIVLNNLIAFLVTATVIFFFVVKPINHLMGRDKDEPPKMRECPHCLTSIKTDATVCAACTREVSSRS
jgi:large conductance mechanosensitive channel